MHLVLEPVAESIQRHIEVIVRLKSQPELRRRPKEAGQPERRISGNSTLAEDDFVDPPRWHPNAEGQAILADAHGL